MTDKEKVAEYVKKNPGIDALDVADHFGMSLPKAATIVNELMNEGTLVPADKHRDSETPHESPIRSLPHVPQ